MPPAVTEPHTPVCELCERGTTRDELPGRGTRAGSADNDGHRRAEMYTPGKTVNAVTPLGRKCGNVPEGRKE